MTKSRKVGLSIAILLIFIWAFTVVIPLHTVNTVNVASAAAPVITDTASTWENQYSGTYYNNLNENLTGAAFRSELAKLITSTHHTNTVYNGSSPLALNNVWPKSDVDPKNPNSGQLKWFYTGTLVSSNNFGGSVGQTNREHVWAKNAGNTFTAESGPGADAHHLRPTECQLNSSRGNLGFAVVAQTTSNIVKQNNSTSYGTGDGLCYKSGSFFYPAKGYRGQTARILMYMQVRYGDQFSLYFVDGASSSNGKGIGKISDLFMWHLLEPPTEDEIYRNNVIAGIQGNRNPFIDHPEYAEMIYCNGYDSNSNTLKNLVAQYGSYLNDNVDPTPTLQSISLSQTSLNLTVGAVSQKITVTAQPAGTSNSVTWSTSNSRVATVSNGVITAVGAGTATITATSTENQNIKATVTVTVSPSVEEPPTLQSISLSQTSLNLMVGFSSQPLTVTAIPSGASNSVTWSTSDSSVATVNNGVVTAVGDGTAIITATSTVNTNIKATVTVSVKSLNPTGLTLSQTSLSLTVGEMSQQITVTASPLGANNSVTWSTSDSSVATVSNGVVTAVGVGTATITATSTVNTSLKATLTVTVNPSNLTGLTLSQTTLSLMVGFSSQPLTVTAIPSSASNSVTWSTSDSSVATVNNGVVTAVGDGTAIITATSTVDPNIKATVTVTVKSPNPTGLKLSQTSLNLTVGEMSQQITVTATPSGANNSVTWTTSNSSVATVNNGIITAVGAGTAIITATSTVDPSISATLTVTVNLPNPTGLTLSRTSLDLTVGDVSEQITVAVTPSNAINSVIWTTSDSSVATVNNGIITAVGAGTAIITVTSTVNPSISATLTVTVNLPNPTGLTLSQTSLDLIVGEMSEQIAVTVQPSNAINSVTWTTSDSSVAIVNNGIITAVGAGTAIITVTSTVDPSISATLTVTVNLPNPTGLTLSQTTLTLTVGDVSEQITVAVTPSNAINSVTWTTSDSSVATVNNGIITAVGAGTAIITVTSTVDPSVSTSLTVTVNLPNPTGLTLSQTALTLTVGDVSQEITVTVQPSNAINSVTWTTSNSSVATVNNGIITAVGAGTAIITVTSTVDPSISATLTVTVNLPVPTGLTLSQTSLDLTVGDKSEQITVAVTPSNAINSVTWTTSNSSVATVNNGVITAVGAGTAIITVTSTADTSIKATLTVTVTEQAADTSGEFLASLASLNNATTLEERYNAISAAINAYNQMSQTDKNAYQAEYAIVQQALEAYNHEVTAVNDEFYEATTLASQALALSVSLAFCALAFIVIKRTVGR